MSMRSLAEKGREVTGFVHPGWCSALSVLLHIGEVVPGIGFLGVRVSLVLERGAIGVVGVLLGLW
jgi:hypothetical protein